VDAPEMNDPDPAVRALAVKAKAFVGASVGGKEVVIRTHKDRADKYGRWLAVVHFRDATGDWSNLNDDLVENGLAASTRSGPPRCEKASAEARI